MTDDLIAVTRQRDNAITRSQDWHRLYRRQCDLVSELHIEIDNYRAEIQKQSRLIEVLRERTNDSADNATFTAIEAQVSDLEAALRSMLDYATNGARYIEGIHNREEWHAARDFAKTTLTMVKESGMY